MSSYFDAWRAHDPDALRALLADDATFTGPLGHSTNADQYRNAIGRMFAITTDIVIQKMLTDHDEALTWFELHTSIPPLPPLPTGAGSRTAKSFTSKRPSIRGRSSRPANARDRRRQFPGRSRQD